MRLSYREERLQEKASNDAWWKTMPGGNGLRDILRKLARAVLPDAVLSSLRQVRARGRDKYYAGLTRRDVFREVYRSNAWGGPRGALYSGPGSDDEYAAPYAAAMREQFHRLAPKRIVDLGCGDFRVGKRLVDPLWEYVGVDIVEDVVRENEKRHGGPEVSFHCLDICADPLPEGDVVLVRQVLQHLSNADIQAVLPKLRSYSWALVTEHVPDKMVVSNLDKPSGPTIRTALQSGVVLHEPPFNFPAGQAVWEVPLGTSAFSGEKLITYLYDLRPR